MAKIANYDNYKILPNGCWEWQGACRRGYGCITINGTTVGAHVFHFERKYRKLIGTEILDHIVCDNRTCCNPDHVIPTSHRKNIQRGPQAKLDIRAVEMLREDHKKGMLQKDLALKYNVAQPTVSQIVRGVTW